MAAIFCGLHSYAQTPITTMDTWQLVVKDGKPHCKHPTKCILWRAAMLATFALKRKAYDDT
jgi:hypothetical protein